MKVSFASEKQSPILNGSLALWASKQIFGNFNGFGPCATMAVNQDDELLAVVVFHNYQPDAAVVELSTASTTPRWLTRKTLAQMFAHAFDSLSCQLVVIRIPQTSHMHRMLKAYGFKAYEIPRLRGRDASEFVYTLADDEWRERGGASGKYRFDR